MTTKNNNLVQFTDKDLESKLKDFSSLLEEIDNINEKKRALWKEIYANAITDRQNAYILFKDLYALINSQSTEFAVHGKTLTTAHERMSQANAQLIKLAEMISKAEEDGGNTNTNDMFDIIKNKK
jgi:single-stranded DNA-specific DHH superfamily exonuclease